MSKEENFDLKQHLEQKVIPPSPTMEPKEVDMKVAWMPELFQRKGSLVQENPVLKTHLLYFTINGQVSNSSIQNLCHQHIPTNLPLIHKSWLNLNYLQ